jgi:hypothetical protein
MKNSLVGFKGRFEQAKERTIKLEERAMEVIAEKKTEEK